MRHAVAVAAVLVCFALSGCIVTPTAWYDPQGGPSVPLPDRMFCVSKISGKKSYHRVEQETGGLLWSAVKYTLVDESGYQEPGVFVGGGRSGDGLYVLQSEARLEGGPYYMPMYLRADGNAFTFYLLNPNKAERRAGAFSVRKIGKTSKGGREKNLSGLPILDGSAGDLRAFVESFYEDDLVEALSCSREG